ncbi:MAG: hypothetical protein RIR09_2872 [Pseudomonadota bacterium]|jgi:hypothetical protein
MLRSFQDIEKCTIGATDGDVGHVKDLYFDDHAWVARYLIVDTGTWLFSRKVLISPIAIQKPDWAAHILPVAITRDQVEKSPTIDTDKPVSRQHEEEYLGYYGYPYYWGGVDLWGSGMYPFEMITGYSNVRGDLATRDAAIEAVQKTERARHRNDDPHLRSGKSVMGYHLHATDGEVGHVEGLLVDDETWAIRYLVVNTSNWWLGHKVLIAPQWIDGIHWSDETVNVDLSRDTVKGAPLYDPSVELDSQMERELYIYYGRMSMQKADSTSEGEI